MPKRIQWVLSEPLYAKGSKISIDGATALVPPTTNSNSLIQELMASIIVFQNEK